MAQDENDDKRISAAARLFDVRRVIGGLFVVYGVIVTLLGIFFGEDRHGATAGIDRERVGIPDG